MLQRNRTYLLPDLLKKLGAHWKGANNPAALESWGMVGFRISQELRNFHFWHDRFALRESFDYCDRENIPVAELPETHFINIDPQQGGLDFMTFEGKLDAAILSWPYMPESQNEAERLRQATQHGKGDIYSVSPECLAPEDWGKAAARIGIKIVFITGATKKELSTQQFEYEGSPYRTLLPLIPTGNYSPRLGVVVHKDHAEELGITLKAA